MTKAGREPSRAAFVMNRRLCPVPFISCAKNNELSDCLTCFYAVAAAIVLGGEAFFDLPHLSAFAVKGMRHGQFPTQIDSSARMHQEQLVNVVSVEGYEICYLLTPRAG
jgi:hypothetical protein